MEKLLFLIALVSMAVALPQKLPHAFPRSPFLFGKPHAQPHALPHGVLGFPFTRLHPGFPFPFLGGFGPLATPDGSCPFYTNPDFINQISSQLGEGDGTCELVGCTLASHVTVQVTACADTPLVSTHSPKGRIRQIPTAQPQGDSILTIKCESGVLSVDGYADEGGKAEAAVLILDQQECYPCRFSTSAYEVLAAVAKADLPSATCSDKGICDLAEGDSVTVRTYPLAGYDVVIGRTLEASEWVSIPKHEFSFELSCQAGLIIAQGFEQQEAIVDVKVLNPNTRFPTLFPGFPLLSPRVFPSH